jgi:two-component system sensor histidine kinase SenX3
MKYRHQSTAVIFVTFAMFIILPILAYLQYAWLGQLSEQEYKRMQENVRTAALHCAMDFDQEIIGLMKSVGGKLKGSDGDVIEELNDRIRIWKAAASHPEIIEKGITVIPAPPDNETVLVKVTEETYVLLFKDLSAIAIPIEGKDHRAASIPIDLKYITSSLIPEIMRSHFSSAIRSDYDFVVFDNNGKVFFGTADPILETLHETADVIVPFLSFPPTPISLMPSGRPTHNQLLPNTEIHHRPFDRMFQEHDKEREFPLPHMAMPPRSRIREMRWSGLYELYIKHRDGSLEAAVNNNRLRSLGISFGVLLLLGVSVGFLLISANRAQRLAQQQLEFVAGISHELRTPLAVLKSAGENLADGVIQEKDRTREYGDLINSEVFRLSEMVEKALAYAGIQSDEQLYELHPLNISAVLEEAVRKAKKTVPNNEFTFEIAIDQKLPQILGNSAALQSAFENLIINALKYSSTSKWIKIVAQAVSISNTPHIEIVIMDHGIGIPLKDLPNIFKPFYRGRNAIDKQIHGSGLGLSITKHIVEAHKGKISVKSSVNEGSAFTIQIPAADHGGENK